MQIAAHITLTQIDEDPMPLVRTFAGLRPPSRADGNPYTGLLVEEAPDADGDPQLWEELTTVTFTDADSDPTSPLARTVTVTANRDPGWYRLTWVDADDGAAFCSMFRCAARPSAGEVAQLLPARTKVMGAVTGEFGDDTIPTAADVDRYITTAEVEIDPQIRTRPIPDNYQHRRNLIVLLTACSFVELGTEAHLRQETDRSPGRNYRAMARDALTALNTELDLDVRGLLVA